MTEHDQPTADDPKVSRAQALAILARVSRLFRPYRRLVTVVATATVVSSGLGVANPLLIRAIFDHALFPPGGGPDMELLIVLVAAMVGVALVTSGIGILQTYLAIRIGQGVMRDLRHS